MSIVLLVNRASKAAVAALTQQLRPSRLAPPPPCTQDCVLLVDSATGDEEVAALGGNLRGIILRHDLPHLSHLGACCSVGGCGLLHHRLSCFTQAV